ncbi:hypothetical protein [Rhizomonospora bruguierae]|uniref:hypothetical protein n=1 Tax=Rhizomonospora bruguierae TaxID=1581705 RepID=UPI001BCF3DE1|nr:hypothetical protein [Micromonospora sp. NBRC 107566]
MDGVFNTAKGRAAYYATLPAADDSLIVVLLKADGLEADDTLNNHATLAAILASANAEADFTNYVRKTLASITVTVDDTNNRVDVDAADFTYAAAGGASNNTLGKLIICYKPASGSTDADIIPLTYHDFTATTDGSDLVAQVAAAGFYRAA